MHLKSNVQIFQKVKKQCFVEDKIVVLWRTLLFQLTTWLVHSVVSLFTVASCYPVLENVTQVLKDPRAGKPIKGKHPPIGPGTDKGLYNQEFFEGDIVLPRKSEVILVNLLFSS